MLHLLPSSPRDRAFLGRFRDTWRREIFLAYDLTAIVGQVETVSETRTGGKELWKLKVRPEEARAAHEVAFASISADRIAEMRARRILLDEKLAGGRGRVAHNDEMLDIFVRGSVAAIEITQSPFPALCRDLGGNVPFFLAAARLVAVLWLGLSGTVEHIFELDLWMAGDAALAVHFEGQRRRQYSNMEPPIIRVDGTCPLTR